MKEYTSIIQKMATILTDDSHDTLTNIKWKLESSTKY